MSAVVVGAVLLGLLGVVLCAGVWIGMSLGIVGWIGLAGFTDTSPGRSLFTAFWGTNASWELAALPLFIWMGEILFRTRLSEQMFEGLAPWLQRIPGRLMHVNILGCGIFGSVSGSSAATCATIAKVALPELQTARLRRTNCARLARDCRHAWHSDSAVDHDGRVCGGGRRLDHSRVSGGDHAGRAADGAVLRLHHRLGADESRAHAKRPASACLCCEKLRRSRELIPCALLIVFILYVLLAGLATATECAAYGVLGSLVIAWWGGSLTRAKFAESLVGATRVSCMIMFILAGASFLSKAMAFTGIPRELAEWVGALGLNRYALIAILAVFYVILGTALDGISMIVLTAAVVLPMIQTAGFDLVWFGVFVVLLVEIAEVTPPVGFNLFVLQNMTGKDSNTIARAALPFFAMLMVAIALITIFPAIATWLPDLVMGVQL